MAQRAYHVVVWGTTGVVGRVVAEQLARDNQKQGLKWAIAGRNRQKLESIRDDLVARVNPSVKELPIITADLSDQGSLEALAGSTRVVLAVAGPFARFGSPMVEACVQKGTNYCDITGESNWVRRMAREHDAAAKEKGIRILHMCGFDSVPSDLGTFLAVKALRERHGRPCARAEVQFSDMTGALSGGTIASLFGAIFDEPGPDRVAFSDPYGLDPPDSARGPDAKDSYLPAYSKMHASWEMPFFMAPVNTRVVRRSNALLGHAYGRSFSYSEALRMPGRVSAWLGSLVFLLFGAVCRLRPLRATLERLLPQPGQMPPRDKLVQGRWAATVKAAAEGQPPAEVTVVAKSNGDAGYWSTARMLIECGLAIALQEEELRKVDGPQAGVLTPAAALGTVLIDRLNAGDVVSFRVVE